MRVEPYAGSPAEVSLSAHNGDQVGPTIAIHVADLDPAASWSLRVWVRTVNDGQSAAWTLLGALITTAPNVTLDADRCVGMAFCPGAIEWRIDVAPLVPTDKATEIRISSADCCVAFPGVVAVAGQSTLAGAGTVGDYVLHFPTVASASAFTVPNGTAPTAFVDELGAPFTFAPGSVTPADGFRVLAHGSGRWMLAADAIRISPLGNAADDWARLNAALRAMAYQGRVVCASGTWRCKSKQVLPSGTRLEFEPGSRVVQSLTPDADPLTAAFACVQGAATATGSIIAPTVAGSHALTVSFAPAVGLILQLIDAATGWHVQPFEVQSVTGAGPYVVTTVQAVRYGFIAGDTARSLASVPSDIEINGNGSVITGTGTRFFELSGAWRSVARDWVIDDSAGMVGDLAASLDVGSHQSRFERVRLRAGATRPLVGLALESATDCAIVDCAVAGASQFGVALYDCLSCDIERTSASASTVAGIALVADGNGRGSVDTRLTACNAGSNAGDGFQFAYGSSGTQLTKCQASNNGAHGFHLTNTTAGLGGPAPAILTRAAVCAFTSNAGAGIWTDAGSDLSIQGVDVSGNGTFGAHTAGDTRIAQLTSTSGNASACVWSASGRLEIDDADVIFTPAAPANAIAIASDTARLTSLHLTLGSSCNGINNAGANVEIEHLRAEPAAGATNTIAIVAGAGLTALEGVDIDTTATPITGTGEVRLAQSAGLTTITTAAGTRALTIAECQRSAVEYVGTTTGAVRIEAPRIAGLSFDVRNSDSGTATTTFATTGGGAGFVVAKTKAARGFVAASGGFVRVSPDT